MGSSEQKWWPIREVLHWEKIVRLWDPCWTQSFLIPVRKSVAWFKSWSRSWRSCSWMTADNCPPCPWTVSPMLMWDLNSTLPWPTHQLQLYHSYHHLSIFQPLIRFCFWLILSLEQCGAGQDRLKINLLLIIGWGTKEGISWRFFHCLWSISHFCWIVVSQILYLQPLFCCWHVLNCAVIRSKKDSRGEKGFRFRCIKA